MRFILLLSLTSAFSTVVSSLLTNRSVISICVSSSDNEIDHWSIEVISADLTCCTSSAAVLTERVLSKTQVTAPVMNTDVVQWLHTQT